MPIEAPVRALFLDRDGVINREVGYLHRIDQVEWVEGIFSLCRTAVELGYKLVVVTNQAGIARGYYTQQQFDALMTWMQQQFTAAGTPFDAIYCCPFHPEHGLGDYKRDHIDRKPQPGMLLRAQREIGVDLAQSVMVGDRCTDLGAAHAAGLRRAFLIGDTELEGCAEPHERIHSLAELEQWLLADAARATTVQAEAAR